MDQSVIMFRSFMVLVADAKEMHNSIWNT